MSNLKPLNLLACAMLAVSPAAQADSGASQRWYASAFGGLNSMSGQRFDYSGPAGDASGNIAMDSGALVGGAVGYRLAPAWRVEGEFAYRSVDNSGGSLSDGTVLEGGDYASTSIALNGLYDFNLFGSEKARSYLGLGLAWLTEVDADFAQPSGEVSFSGDGFGVQLLAGARYDVGERVFLDAGVRYLLASGIELEAETGEGRFEADYEPWAVTLGIGWKF